MNVLFGTPFSETLKMLSRNGNPTFEDTYSMLLRSWQCTIKAAPNICIVQSYENLWEVNLEVLLKEMPQGVSDMIER